TAKRASIPLARRSSIDRRSQCEAQSPTEAASIAAMRIVGWLAGPALTAALIGAAGRAHGDPRIDKAHQLFAEGRALMASNLTGACDKFVEPLQYTPAAIGTLLNVALCDEKLGKIASALARFTDARDRAKEQNLPEHVRAAEDHIASLTPSVPHLA